MQFIPSLSFRYGIFIKEPPVLTQTPILTMPIKYAVGVLNWYFKTDLSPSASVGVTQVQLGVRRFFPSRPISCFHGEAAASIKSIAKMISIAWGDGARSRIAEASCGLAGGSLSAGVSAQRMRRAELKGLCDEDELLF